MRRQFVTYAKRRGRTARAEVTAAALLDRLEGVRAAGLEPWFGNGFAPARPGGSRGPETRGGA